MKRVLFALIVVVILISVGLLFGLNKHIPSTTSLPKQKAQVAIPTVTNEKTNTPTTMIADHLTIPWAIASLPDGFLLATERTGRVLRIDPNKKEAPTAVATLPEVKVSGEGGLLGLVLHPDFANNQFVYLYYTYSTNGVNTLNRVVRMTYRNNLLSDEKMIVEAIPGSLFHDGGRIKFGPDGYLYIGTGDAQEPSLAQDTKSLAGKILRVTDSGSPAPGNPFGNAVYSYGHRNVQGLAWNNKGELWATEHGVSGLETGLDEINHIELGKNYGWPVIKGDQTQAGMVKPVYNSGTTTTWAPSGAVFVGDSLFFGGLRGQSLYEAVIADGKVTTFTPHLVGTYGRLRDVIAANDGLLYVTTSNKDGRGSPMSDDDRILLVNPEQ